MNSILELFGISSKKLDQKSLNTVLKKQICPYTETTCFKVRKSRSDISIGTCSVGYGQENKLIIICPNRLLDKNRVFCDCIHLLTKHEPGNEFHVIPEISIPGGSIDFFLASVRNGKVRDFVAIEFQTMDTTGTVWPERQRLLYEKGIKVDKDDIESRKPFGMNWKMTAKTILVQMHHKAETIENLGKHIVLITQNHLLDYMQQEFRFEHLSLPARLGDSVHFHSYSFEKKEDQFVLSLSSRLSTDALGIASCLGIQDETKIEMDEMVNKLERKISAKTLMTLV
jgi:hypothetical protein